MFFPLRILGSWIAIWIVLSADVSRWRETLGSH
jgi:hypothetical protein